MTPEEASRVVAEWLNDAMDGFPPSTAMWVMIDHIQAAANPDACVKKNQPRTVAEIRLRAVGLQLRSIEREYDGYYALQLLLDFIDGEEE